MYLRGCRNKETTDEIVKFAVNECSMTADEANNLVMAIPLK